MSGAARHRRPVKGDEPLESERSVAPEKLEDLLLTSLDVHVGGQALSLHGTVDAADSSAQSNSRCWR
jgi:hypothetical protein